MPLGRLASGSWSQLSTPTLDKTRPLLAGKRKSINVYGQKSSAACEMTRERRWFPSDYSAFIRKSVEIGTLKLRKSVKFNRQIIRKSVAG